MFLNFFSLFNYSLNKMADHVVRRDGAPVMRSREGAGWPRHKSNAYTPPTSQLLSSGQLTVDRTISLYVCVAPTYPSAV